MQLMKSITMREIVPDGYRHLATKNLNAAKDFGGLMQPNSKEMNVANKFASSLETLSNSGDTSELRGFEAIFRNIVKIADRTIPSKEKPDSQETCVNLAISALSAKLNIDRYELVNRANISMVDDGGKEANFIADMGASCKLERTFVAAFDPKLPALSVLMNINMLIHAMQEEFNQFTRLENDFLGLKNMRSFMENLNMDMVQHINNFTKAYTFIDYFIAFPQFLRMAVNFGVPKDDLNTYVAEFAPKIRFLKALSFGEAYAGAADAIVCAPEIACNNTLKISYHAMAVADMSICMYASQMEFVGLGLAGYFDKYPQMRSEFLNSKQLIGEFNKVYFGQG